MFVTPGRSSTPSTPVSARPAFEYFGPDNLLDGVHHSGPLQEIVHEGRRSVRAASIHTRLHLHKGHTLDAPRGALTFWVLPLETLRPGIWWGHFMEAEPNCDRYALLSSHPQIRDVMAATFSLAWQQFWWRPLMARFCARHPETHYRWWSHFGPCEFHFTAGRWTQLGLSWDRERQTASLYADGICIGRTDSWKRPIFDRTGADLYAGNPAFALGKLSFFEGAWTDDDFDQARANEAPLTDPSIDGREELLAVHGGCGLKQEPCPLPEDYHLRFECSLTNPEDLSRFYVQGNIDAVRVTPDGLLIETPQGSPPMPEEKRDADDKLQVYLHTWDVFEGDLHLAFEFKPLAHEGLGLVMVQAQGMQREDFMRDHPLRTTGSMRMVCWENVRNYHWEFFREMEGIRNDVATHAFMKNPYFRGLAYQTMRERLALNQWHRMQLHQDGPRWRAFVNGVKVFDVTDSESAHAGPVYNCGRVALRNMRNTRMLWRNLKILTRPTPWQVTTLC